MSLPSSTTQSKALAVYQNEGLANTVVKLARTRFAHLAHAAFVRLMNAILVVDYLESIFWALVE